MCRPVRVKFDLLTVTVLCDCSPALGDKQSVLVLLMCGDHGAVVQDRGWCSHLQGAAQPTLALAIIMYDITQPQTPTGRNLHIFTIIIKVILLNVCIIFRNDSPLCLCCNVH